MRYLHFAKTNAFVSHIKSLEEPGKEICALLRKQHVVVYFY